MNRARFFIGTFFIAIFSVLFIMPSRAMGSVHYVAASGSDSNNGTSETTPWLHAPGMPSCTGSCKSYTPVAGDRIIFRGGDTWHFGNPSLSPYVGGSWIWNWSGTSGNVIYVGVDQNWYSGISWVRPIFTGDNSLTPNPGTVGDTVSSCSYQVTGGNQWINGSASYVTFDNFEFTGFCWDASQAGFGNNIMFKMNGSSTPANNTISNSYFHGWTHTSSGAQGGNNGGTAMAGYNQEPGLIIDHDVVDGSDSDPASLNWAEADAYIVQYV